MLNKNQLYNRYFYMKIIHRIPFSLHHQTNTFDRFHQLLFQHLQYHHSFEMFFCSNQLLCEQNVKLQFKVILRIFVQWICVSSVFALDCRFIGLRESRLLRMAHFAKNYGAELLCKKIVKWAE